MNFWNESKMYNSWVAITMDYLMNEENREEVQQILEKIFSYDTDEAKAYIKKGLKLLEELGEKEILLSIERRDYLLFGGVRD